jgi:hypothetical protein
MPDSFWIATPKAIAAKLGMSERRVQQLIRELEIVPVQVVGKSQILSDADIQRLASRNKQVGRPRKRPAP